VFVGICTSICESTYSSCSRREREVRVSASTYRTGLWKSNGYLLRTFYKYSWWGHSFNNFRILKIMYTVIRYVCLYSREPITLTLCKSHLDCSTRLWKKALGMYMCMYNNILHLCTACMYISCSLYELITDTSKYCCVWYKIYLRVQDRAQSWWPCNGRLGRLHHWCTP